MISNTINKSIFLGITSFLVFISFSSVADAALILQAPKYIGLDSGLVGYWSFNGADIAGIVTYDKLKKS